MPGLSTDWAWGSWVLGDLADAVRRTTDLLGAGLEPLRVTLAPPVTAGDLPRVVVVVEDQHTMFRLRAEVRREEHLASFVGTPTAEAWRAEVDGVDLTVTLEQGAPSW